MPKNNKKGLKKINSSLLGRTLSVAKLGLGAGLNYAASKVTGKSKDEFLIGEAANFAKEFGKLKGSLMKAGQVLSMYGEYFFPPEANHILKSLQSDSPPLEWPVVRDHLESYLDSELLAELEINPVPIGTASLGQVHKAKIVKTGEWIALKIQYPGVEAAIDSDLRALKNLLKVSRLLPEGIDLGPVFQEVKTMLHRELDYVTEAEQTEKYRELVGTLPDSKDSFIVPQVFPRYSNNKVLATEFLEGFRADHPLIQSIPQKRRDRLSENFLELYLREIFVWNFVQTDPHLGNYKIQIDPLGKDRLVLFDFGATTSFTNEFLTAYRRLIKGAIEFNEPVFFNAARDLGFIIDSDTAEYTKAFSEFCYGTVEPFWKFEDPRNGKKNVKPGDIYDWKETDLPRRVMNKAWEFRKFDLRTPPREMIFLDRKTGGVFIFLAVLRAQINARKIIEPFLAKV